MVDAPSPLVWLAGAERLYRTGSSVAGLLSVDLEIVAGEYVAITGPSGSGKSTLLNVIGLLDRLTAGKYFLADRDTSRLSDRDLTRLRSGSIGFVFQAFHLMPHRSLYENVRLGSIYQSGPGNLRSAETVAAIERVGLGHRIGSLARTLSGGEQQRAAIARAIASEPSLLICDEPTGNLDTQNAASILDLIDELVAAGQTVIVATHDPNVSVRSHRVVSIVDGRAA